MSPEAQRIAIAEACGWKFPELTPGIVIHPKGGEISRVFALSQVGPACVPDYLNDLNAMHEATTGLDILQSMDFAVHILRITGAPRVPDRTWLEIFQACHATAAQRAEAFLRTLNLWNDTQ